MIIEDELLQKGLSIVRNGMINLKRQFVGKSRQECWSPSAPRTDPYVMDCLIRLGLAKKETC